MYNRDFALRILSMIKSVSFVRTLIAAGLVLFISGYAAEKMVSAQATAPANVNRTVFVILMENHNWSSIIGSASAPYINNTLLTMGAHAEQYYNPPKIHPSEPNYIWLEAGDNFGIRND